eukprot:SAG11_NODE_8167_length_1053_cov_1.220126_1_plen_229_part_01
MEAISPEIMAEYPGVVPAPSVTADPQRCLELIDRDGACILQAVPSGAGLDGRSADEMKELVASVAPRVFKERLLYAKEPTRIARGSSNPLASLPHQDAAGPYGNAMSDYMILVGDTPADRGGESYVLDMRGILASLEPRLRDALAKVCFQQTAAHHTDFGRGNLPPPGSAEAEAAAGVGVWGGPLFLPGSADGTLRPFFRCPTGGGTKLHLHLDEPATWQSDARQALGA